MKKHSELRNEFVEFIPDEVEEGVLYMSMKYSTAVHRCCCGCGSEVVTPLSPARWQLSYDGESISLHPSIGNWSFPCRSHYWIRNNQVRWSDEWSHESVQRGRAADAAAIEEHLRKNIAEDKVAADAERPPKISFLSKLAAWVVQLLKPR